MGKEAEPFGKWWRGLWASFPREERQKVWVAHVQGVSSPTWRCAGKMSPLVKSILLVTDATRWQEV